MPDYKLTFCVASGETCPQPIDTACELGSTEGGGNQCCTASDCAYSGQGTYCCLQKDSVTGEYNDFLSCSLLPCDCGGTTNDGLDPCAHSTTLIEISSNEKDIVYPTHACIDTDVAWF